MVYGFYCTSGKEHLHDSLGKHGVRTTLGTEEFCKVIERRDKVNLSYLEQLDKGAKENIYLVILFTALLIYSRIH